MPWLCKPAIEYLFLSFVLFQTFLTLSLSDMANRVQLSSPREAEQYILNMVRWKYTLNIVTENALKESVRAWNQRALLVFSSVFPFIFLYILRVANKCFWPSSSLRIYIYMYLTGFVKRCLQKWWKRANSAALTKYKKPPTPPLCLGHRAANQPPTAHCGTTLTGDQKQTIIQA